MIKKAIAETVERLGISTVLLLLVAYAVYTSVLLPLSQTAAETLKKVGEVNESLAMQQKENDREDGERVRLIEGRLDAIEAKVDRLLSRPGE